MREITLPAVLTFDWDIGNTTKSWIRHRVSAKEQEEAFLAKERMIVEDENHSKQEKRFLLYSKTCTGRRLIVAFTIRNIEQEEKIRPISARSMNGKEARLYEEKIKMAKL